MALFKWRAGPSYWPYHFAGICFRVAERDVTMQVHLIIIPNEFEDGYMEAARQGHPILCHTDGVVLDVWTSAVYVFLT